jgi:hypothetical protein
MRHAQTSKKSVKRAITNTVLHLGNKLVNGYSTLQNHDDSGNTECESSPLVNGFSVLYLRIREMTKSKTLLFAALLSILTAGCGGIESDPTYTDKQREELYKYGSLMSDDGGFDIFGGPEKKKIDGSGIGVNGFLWRATLDTISFMPIASADPFGGVIITDWYSTPENQQERTKLNIFIRDRDLRADGVKVSVFRQTKDDKGEWANASVAPATAGSLENTILTRARQIRMAQKQID